MPLTLSGSALGLGKVLQVVYAQITTATVVTGTTWTDTTITASITPSSAGSRILVIVNVPLIIGSSSSTIYAGHRLLRGSTVVYRDDPAALGMSLSSGAPYYRIPDTLVHVDSPASTSATSYKTQARLNAGTGEINVNNSGSASITLVEVAP